MTDSTRYAFEYEVLDDPHAPAFDFEVVKDEQVGAYDAIVGIARSPRSRTTSSVARIGWCCWPPRCSPSSASRASPPN